MFSLTRRESLHILTLTCRAVQSSAVLYRGDAPHDAPAKHVRSIDPFPAVFSRTRTPCSPSRADLGTALGDAQNSLPAPIPATGLCAGHPRARVPRSAECAPHLAPSGAHAVLPEPLPCTTLVVEDDSLEGDPPGVMVLTVGVL
jgi:hypothetical protein